MAYEDSTLIGQLLGIKIVASEFVAYTQLAELQSVANSLHFQYQKSTVMATYMLCGFANFASIGIQIEVLESLLLANENAYRTWATRYDWGNPRIAFISNLSRNDSWLAFRGPKLFPEVK